MAATAEPERLLCDTSFVSIVRARRARPERVAHWDPALLARIDAAILAISVIILAEARFGYLKANWGEARIEAEEHRLASFLQIPLDRADLDEWARLRDAARRSGVALGDNDLWIAATASTRGHPLLTCDRDHQRLDPHLPVEVICMPRSA